MQGPLARHTKGGLKLQLDMCILLLMHQENQLFTYVKQLNTIDSTRLLCMCLSTKGFQIRSDRVLDCFYAQKKAIEFRTQTIHMLTFGQNFVAYYSGMT